MLTCGKPFLLHQTHFFGRYGCKMLRRLNVLPLNVLKSSPLIFNYIFSCIVGRAVNILSVCFFLSIIRNSPKQVYCKITIYSSYCKSIYSCSRPSTPPPRDSISIKKKFIITNYRVYIPNIHLQPCFGLEFRNDIVFIACFYIVVVCRVGEFIVLIMFYSYSVVFFTFVVKFNFNTTIFIGGKGF